ncbi:MAG: hypothetical protein JNL90_02440 [Planctomycetes bacterium]|nr:hypothetical protein [Planctomycetota bacterium]
MGQRRERAAVPVPVARLAAAGVAAVALLLAPLGCRSPPEASWKSVVLADVDRAQLFEICRGVVVAHYGGTVIHVDAAAGKIETGPIEETIGGKVLRQQCYVDVQERDGQLEVALFAPMTRREFDPSGNPPVTWLPLGSDVVVEGLLLDEIVGKALAYDLDARVVSSTLPRPAPRR